jgi:hypothetical protein
VLAYEKISQLIVKVEVMWAKKILLVEVEVPAIKNPGGI